MLSVFSSFSSSSSAISLKMSNYSSLRLLCTKLREYYLVIK
jgi:hypothetical protein